MGQISAVLRGGKDILTFFCPGCGEPHTISIAQGGWKWDGNAERPTFQPSVLVTSGHHTPGHTGDCWCRYNANLIAKGEKPSSFKCERCHSFVRAGQIQFLGDCTHALAGKTVPLPPLPDHLTDG